MQLYTLRHKTLATPDWLADEKPVIAENFNGLSILLLFADDLPHAGALEAVQPRILRNDQSVKVMVQDIAVERTAALLHIMRQVPGFADLSERMARNFSRGSACISLGGMMYSDATREFSAATGNKPVGASCKLMSPPRRAVILLSNRHWTFANACSYTLGLPAEDLTDTPASGYLQAEMWHELGHVLNELHWASKIRPGQTHHMVHSWPDELSSDITVRAIYQPRLAPYIYSHAKNLRLLTNFLNPIDPNSPRYWNTLSEPDGVKLTRQSYWQELGTHTELKLTAAQAVALGKVTPVDIHPNCATSLDLAMNARQYRTARAAFAVCSPRNPRSKLDLLATLSALARFDGFSRPETAELARLTRDAAYILMPKLMHRLAI